MRITFITAPATWHGGFKVNVIHAQQLLRMGHTVRIISSPPGNMTFNQKARHWLQGNGWPGKLSRRKSYVDGSGVDHQVLDRFRPVTDDDVPDGDVVITGFWPMAESVAALSARKGAKVYFIQGYDMYGHSHKARVRATYRLPLHKIVVSQWLKRIISEESGDNVIDVVPNSVDRSQFFAAPRGKQPKPSVGFLYSDGVDKGLDSTLSVLRIVRQRFPDLQMISFGVRRPSRLLPLPKGTEFVHLPPQNEIRALYARCDAWISAGWNEGFNLTALEAMACRTPVVSTRTGWPHEAIRSGRNGVIVNIHDVRGLALGTEWVLARSDDEWRKLSANALATSASGSWQESAKLFEEALSHARARSVRGEIGGGPSSTFPEPRPRQPLDIDELGEPPTPS